MKSNKGATITSIAVYVVVITIVVITVGTIITYFSKNLKMVDVAAISDAEYMKFNMYFTDEINTKANEPSSVTADSIVFNNGNQYKYQNNKIYKNKVKICENIENCLFSYDTTTGAITVNMTIRAHNYNTTYTVVKN